VSATDDMVDIVDMLPVLLLKTWGWLTPFRAEQTQDIRNLSIGDFQEGFSSIRGGTV